VLSNSASPSQVQVEVLNGSGVNGTRSAVAKGLADRGFHVVKGHGAAHHQGRTVIEYGAPTQRSKANAVAAQLPGAKVKQVTSLSTGPVVVILGARDSNLKPPPKPSSGHKVATQASKYGGINGTARCRSDAGAFAGPLSP
jgi:hypothetical protein